MRLVAGTIPILNKDRFLMIRSKNDKFIFPKGGVKKNETEMQAAIRETKEEAGLDGQIMEKPFTTKRDIIFYILKVTSIPQVQGGTDLRDLLVVPFDYFRSKRGDWKLGTNDQEKEPEIAKYAEELANEVLNRMEELNSFLFNP